MASRKKSVMTSTLPWWEEMLRGQRAGLFAESLRKAAHLGSWGYKVGVRGREIAYEKGLLRVKRLPRPTICVGNITVGGTGKTPLVMRLVADLLEQGCRPAVLLRGYKRERVTSRPVLVRDPQAIRAGLAESGDEAMELAARLPGACVGVGADRYAAGMMILENYPIDCFIMDDGFQHYQLYRDLNIVTLDVTDPWGGGKLLPAGLLRESPDALRRADVVMLTRTGLLGPDRLKVLRAEVSTFLRDNVPILESRHDPQSLMNVTNRKEKPLAELKGRSILAVSGIANPRSFEDSLTRLGAEVRECIRLGDHRGNARDVWPRIASRHRDGEWIVMTEKDAVRWQSPDTPKPLLSQSYFLRMELGLSSGQDLWQDMIKRLAVHVG
jgi:tetraacyldisaccharide 4'-kinase